MGSQSTGLGVKNPRANCAWRNLRPSSAVGSTIISVTSISASDRLSDSPDCPGAVLALPDGSDLHSLSRPAEPDQPRTPLRFSLSLSLSLSLSPRPTSRRDKLANPGQPSLSARARSREAVAIHPVAASTDGRSVAGSRRRQAETRPSFDFFPSACCRTALYLAPHV